MITEKELVEALGKMKKKYPSLHHTLGSRVFIMIKFLTKKPSSKEEDKDKEKLKSDILRFIGKDKNRIQKLLLLCNYIPKVEVYDKAINKLAGNYYSDSKGTEADVTEALPMLNDSLERAKIDARNPKKELGKAEAEAAPEAAKAFEAEAAEAEAKQEEEAEKEKEKAEEEKEQATES